MRPTPACPSLGETSLCDRHCDHYLTDHECGVYFCDLNATGGCVDFM
ncbi:MAG: hypothetical protein MUO26_04160 [Methanotrichaceae archaeon]|nr:hypothetical protein [Methanotrichaceae archaeon]